MNNTLTFCMQLSRSTANMTRRLDLVLSSVHGISWNDFNILFYLQQAVDQKLRRVDLAERMGLTASGVTRSLLPLEKLGWVTRVSDERDARVAYAVLTEQGAELMGNAMLTATDRSDALLRSAGEESIVAMNQWLQNNLMV
jgi:DNA-binding MarR family transcriptional regulator